MIECRDLVKVYDSTQTATVALAGVNLCISTGEYLAIMGPSGSGKSTLMHLLGALDTPTSGEYFFEGKDVSQLDDDELADIRRTRIGFVFQSFNLLPSRHRASAMSCSRSSTRGWLARSANREPPTRSARRGWKNRTGRTFPTSSPVARSSGWPSRGP